MRGEESTLDTSSVESKNKLPGDRVAIESVLHLREKSALQRVTSTQTFWVSVVILLMVTVMSFRDPYFASTANAYNVTRNAAFIGLTSLGMTVVITAGGIDLSIGSIIGLVSVASALTLHNGGSWYMAIFVGFAAGGIAGAINGWLIAYVNLPPFVVTLGMLSAARSVAIILSGERVISGFGPDGPSFKMFGGGDFLGIANPVWFVLVLTGLLAIVLNLTAWGRHVRAIGGNEQAARLTGVPVARIKLQTYIVSAECAALTAMLTIGWTGSGVNSLGTGYELRAIASSVIGGANLLGGDGSAFGALAGSALLELIRNSLLMAGIDFNWQGLLVGLFIVLAVLVGRIRERMRE
jgi:ribose transport system permease protein